MTHGHRSIYYGEPTTENIAAWDDLVDRESFTAMAPPIFAHIASYLYGCHKGGARSVRGFS